MNNFSLKVFVEFYAGLPLLLIALAGTYKFGYFDTLNASWVLSSLSAQGLVYSILGTALIFFSGVALASFYHTLALFLSHLTLIISISVFITLLGVFTNFNIFLKIISYGGPSILGFLYYTYLKDIFNGGEIAGILAPPGILIFTIMGFGLMYSSGVYDANKDIENRNFPIVLFDEQPAYPNNQTDWRLLEVSGNNSILINLNSSNSTRFPIKVIESNKVDLIY